MKRAPIAALRQLANDVDALHPRHREIEQDKVGPKHRCEFHGFDAVARLGDHVEPGSTSSSGEGPRRRSGDRRRSGF